MVSSTVTVIEAEVLLSHSSVAVKVTIVSPSGNIAGASFTMSTSASQMSVAVAVSGTTVPATVCCSTTTSAGMVSSGAVVSSIVKAAVVFDVLLQSSVAVKVTRADPVAPQSSERTEKSLLQVTPPQVSLAFAPPLLVSQAFNSAVLPAPSHSTVLSLAGVSMVGGVVSTTVIVCT